MAKKTARKARARPKTKAESNVKAAAKTAGRAGKGIAKEEKLSFIQKLMAVISYIWILFIIPLIAMKNDKFVHFHARQGLVLFMASIIVSIIALIPVLGVAISAILSLILFVFWVIAVANAIMGKAWLMPVIGDWAQRLDL